MRLDRLPTLRINPSETCTLHYNGKTSQGVAGDTVATALYANGVRVFGRSLKYHRPRGLYSLDGECSNTCMAVDGIPNVRAENTPAKNGMHVDAQNVQGSADFDWMGFMDKLDWLMPAGFYYRTLHKPAWLWPFALKQVRKVAGLGKISPDFKMKGRYAEIYPTADVCVIGGGAAGMSAALAAAEGGLRVILLEARPWLGGSFDYRVSPYDGEKALYQRARELAAQVEAAANIRVFTHAANVGLYNNNLVTAFQVGPAGRGFRRTLHRDPGGERGRGHRLHRKTAACLKTTSARGSCRSAAPTGWRAPTDCCRATGRSSASGTTWAWKRPSTCAIWEWRSPASPTFAKTARTPTCCWPWPNARSPSCAAGWRSKRTAPNRSRRSPCAPSRAASSARSNAICWWPPPASRRSRVP